MAQYPATEKTLCAYCSNQEFLKDALSFWDMLLSILTEVCHYNDENEQNLYIRGLYCKDHPGCSDDDDQLEISEETVRQVREADAYILARASCTDVLPPLLRLREELQLNTVEYIALLAAFAYDYDVNYQKMYSALQNGTDVPTAALCCAAAALFQADYGEEEANEFISRTSPVFRMFFVQGEKTEIVGRIRYPLFLTDRTLQFILDENLNIAAPLQDFCRLAQYESFRQTVIRQDMIRQMLDLIEFREHICIIVCGVNGSGKKSVIQTTALQLGQDIMYLDVCAAMQSGIRFHQLADLLRAELFFTQSILCLQIDRTDGTLKPEQFIERLLPEISEYTPLVFVTADSAGAELKHLRHPKVIFELPILTTQEKMQVWETSGNKPALEAGFSLETLLSHYMLNMDETNRVAVSSQHYAVLDGRTNVSESDIIRAIKMETARSFGNIAEPIPAVFRMEDILLTPEQKTMFYNIAHICQSQNSVYEQWDMKQRYPYGSGFCILFYGSPGTGKTMGAQVLANLLEYPLYRVDLSQIVNKYIGETEKNITRLFDYAKNVNCVLFFDEADALFAKRAEVRDSHDKHSNATTSHLLQKLESFTGIAILATNYIQNIDDAFRRRIRFAVNFGFPSQSEREQLWNTILPAPEYRKDIDIPYLAQMFELTGSNIKEITANACCMAYADGSLLTMKYLTDAIRMNYAKHNKTLPIIIY